MKRKFHLIVTSCRREIGSALIGIAVVLVIGNLNNEPALPNVITVATRAMSAGAVVNATDVHTVQVPSTVNWVGSLRSEKSAVGKKLARPIRAGQPLTESDFIGKSLLSGLRPNLQAVALPMSDVTNSMIASVGNQIDIYASSREFGARTTLVAHGVRVLVSASQENGTVFAENHNSIPLTVAVTDQQAATIARYIGSSVFSIAVLS